MSEERGWRTIEVPDAELAWTEDGSGPTTIWAHAVSSSSFGMDDAGMFDWSPVVASGRRLVRFDARGHGRSSGRAVPEDFAFSRLAEDLLTVVDTVSPGMPVSAVGSSLGTATLLHAAVARPDAFDRLVLTSPPTAWETRAPQAAMYAAAAGLIEAQGAAAFEAMVANAGSPEIFRELPGYPPAQDVSEALLPSLLRGIGASDLPAPEKIAELRLPVLILAWATDPGHPVSTARRLAELIPGSRVEIAETLDELRGWGSTAAAFLG